MTVRYWAIVIPCRDGSYLGRVVDVHPAEDRRYRAHLERVGDKIIGTYNFCPAAEWALWRLLKEHQRGSRVRRVCPTPGGGPPLYRD